MTKTKIKTKQINIVSNFDSKNLFNSITREFNSNDIYKKTASLENKALEQTNKLRLSVFVVLFLLITFYALLPYMIEFLANYIKIKA